MSGQLCDLSIISQQDKILSRLVWKKTISSILKHRIKGKIHTPIYLFFYLYKWTVIKG